MSDKIKSRLRFNFGFLLESDLGTSREIELNYPEVRVGRDVELRPLQGVFQATHTSKGIYLQGKLNTTIKTECTRCLDKVRLPVTVELDDLFYYPPSAAPEGEFFMGEDGFIDLSPLLRELSLLEVPMQVLCRPDCQGICSECGQNLNEGLCACDREKIDPRLAALKALLDGESLN